MSNKILYHSETKHRQQVLPDLLHLGVYIHSIIGIIRCCVILECLVISNIPEDILWKRMLLNRCLYLEVPLQVKPQTAA